MENRIYLCIDLKSFYTSVQSSKIADYMEQEILVIRS